MSSIHYVLVVSEDADPWAAVVFDIGDVGERLIVELGIALMPPAALTLVFVLVKGDLGRC